MSIRPRKKTYAMRVAEETLIFDATEAIARELVERKMTQKDLARLLNVSESWASRLLSGERNTTLRSLADAAHVLGLKFEVKLVRGDPAPLPPIPPADATTGGPIGDLPR